MSGTTPEFNPTMETSERLQPFDVHESSERAGLIKLVVGFGILLALAFIVMKLYQPGTRARTDPPLITAENTPFKIVPEDAQGKQTPDQDKEVFDVMSGGQPSTDIVTLPAPEVPIALPEASTSSSEEETAPPTQTAQTPEPQAQVNTAQPAQSEPAPAPAIEIPTERQPVPAAVASVSNGGSEWVVQVASLRTHAEAEATFANIQTKNASILANYGVDIRRVDLAEKGIYYRARVDGFADRSAAAATCDQLKAAGQACFVTRR